MLEAIAWLIYSYVTQGKLLNFFEPWFARLSNGCDHFEHSGSKTKQVGVQTWVTLMASYQQIEVTLGKEVSIAQPTVPQVSSFNGAGGQELGKEAFQAQSLLRKVADKWVGDTLHSFSLPHD